MPRDVADAEQPVTQVDLPLADGSIRSLDAARLAAPLDGVLRALSLAVPMFAAGVLAVRL